MSSAGQRKDSLESLGRQHVHVGVGKKRNLSVCCYVCSDGYYYYRM